MDKVIPEHNINLLNKVLTKAHYPISEERLTILWESFHVKIHLVLESVMWVYSEEFKQSNQRFSRKLNVLET